MDPKSNPGHSLQIGRSQVIGAHRRRWVAGAPLLRGGARLGLAGVGRKWPSGHEIERGLALEHARGTRKPLGHSGERIGARDAVSGGDGGRTRRSSPARAF